MNYELNVIFVKILPIIVTNSGFKKQEFIVETQEQNPQKIKFEIHNSKINELNLDKLFFGEEINIFFNLRGKEWISQQNEIIYFQSFVCWKIKRKIDYEKSPYNNLTQYQFNFPPSSEIFGD